MSYLYVKSILVFSTSKDFAFKLIVLSNSFNSSSDRRFKGFRVFETLVIELKSALKLVIYFKLYFAR